MDTRKCETCGKTMSTIDIGRFGIGYFCADASCPDSPKSPGAEVKARRIDEKAKGKGKGKGKA